MTALTYAGVLMPVLLQDGAGNAQTRVGVQVLNVDGTAASVYSDADRTPVTGQVASDGHGNVSGYFAEPGQVYRLVFHVEAQPVEVLTFSGIDVREIAGVKDTATAALVKSLNLADLTSASAARTNLGLGSAATQPTSAFDPAGAATAAQSAAISAASTDATSKVAAEATARASAITSAVSTLLNGAGPAYDTLKELQDLLTADESTATALAATVAARRAYVVHGATASTARPSSSGPVDWIGSVAPTNAIAGDEWRDTTTDPYTLKVKGTSGFGALGGTSVASSLTPTAVKTSAYTAAAGDLVPVDTTSGSVTITAPTAPADKSTIEVKVVTRPGTNNVTVQLGGSDVINKTGGATSLTLTLLGQYARLQYQASGGIWLVVDEGVSPATIQQAGSARLNPVTVKPAGRVKNLTLTKYASNPVVTLASSASLTAKGTLYWPYVVNTTGTSASPPDKYVMLLSTNHDATTGGISMLSAPSPFGPWTDRGALYTDTSSGYQTETPCLIWVPETSLWHLYYQQFGPSGAVGIQSTMLATSPDLVTWTRVGIQLDITLNDVPGDGHTGYFWPVRIGGSWFGQSLKGGTNYPHSGYWYSDDGKTWVADPHAIGTNQDYAGSSAQRLSPQFPLYVGGRLYAWTSRANFISGASSSLTDVGIIPMSPDFRRPIGPMTALLSLADLTATWETSLDFQTVCPFIDNDGAFYLYYQIGNSVGAATIAGIIG